MTCKEGILFSRDLDRIPIDFRDQHTTASQRTAHDRHMRAVFTAGFDLGHIRMPHVIFRKRKGNRDALLFRKVKCITNGAAVRRIAHQSCCQCAIGSMAFPRLCKRTIECNLRLFQRLSQNAACDLPNAGRPCGMRAGWPDHDGPDDIENSHFSFSLSHNGKVHYCIIKICPKGQISFKHNRPTGEIRH